MNVNQSGNVLFYILIAVGLLAALSYATTQGSRGKISKVSAEQARVDSIEIIEYSNILAQAVQQLRLRGCAETGISFANDFVSGYEHTPTASSECLIFGLDGGGINFDQGYSFLITAGYSVENIGTDPDTDLLVDFTVDQAVCEAINDRLGIANDGTDGPPADAMGGGAAFQGAYTAAGGALAARQVSGSFTGKKGGCRTDSGTGVTAVFKYYRVLLAR